MGPPTTAATDSDGKYLRPSDELIKEFFDRYDLDGSKSVNSLSELRQLTTNLIVKLRVRIRPEEINRLVELNEDSIDWSPGDFQKWFFEAFNFSESTDYLVALDVEPTGDHEVVLPRSGLHYLVSSTDEEGARGEKEPACEPVGAWELGSVKRSNAPELKFSVMVSPDARCARDDYYYSIEIHWTAMGFPWCCSSGTHIGVFHHDKPTHMWSFAFVNHSDSWEPGEIVMSDVGSLSIAFTTNTTEHYVLDLRRT